GTLATHQVVGMGAACRLAQAELAAEAARVGALRDRLWLGLRDLEAVSLNGDPERRAPGILNVCIEQVEGEALIMALREVALSSGSACSSGSHEPSYVLRAMGLSAAQADSSLRFSLGRFTTDAEIEATVALLRAAIPRLRELSPAWVAGHGTAAGGSGPSSRPAQ
ncbi:MAG TPA: aminotransferase class V-fold PLP-dependent enzyme, partial [Gammaproteobacteria bacterium]